MPKLRATKIKGSTVITRNSAIADKPRDTFRGQAKHGIIPYV